MPLSSAGLDPRRRRILFRARRRGLREMDLALAAFADAHLADLAEAELAEVEAWLDLPDPDILAWLTGEAPLPRRFDTPLFAKLGRARRGSAPVNAPVAAATRLRQPTAITLARAPEGFDAFVVADLARALAREAENRAVALTFTSPAMPARPGVRRRARLRRARDRGARCSRPGTASPTTASRRTPAIAAQRMTALARLALTRGARERPRILVDHRQRADAARAAAQPTSPGPRSRPRRATCVDMETLVAWLETNGFSAREPRARRRRLRACAAASSISTRPACRRRCGSTSSATRWNRSAPSIPRRSAATGQLRALDLVPMSEAQLTTDTIRRFRQGYVAAFGAPTRGDALYEAISEGRRAIGLEHWLPLFYDKLDTLFDYLGDAPLVLDARAEDVANEPLRADRGLLRRAQAARASRTRSATTTSR